MGNKAKTFDLNRGKKNGGGKSLSLFSNEIVFLNVKKNELLMVYHLVSVHKVVIGILLTVNGCHGYLTKSLYWQAADLYDRLRRIK